MRSVSTNVALELYSCLLAQLEDSHVGHKDFPIVQSQLIFE
jgi:hypothetical protein